MSDEVKPERSDCPSHTLVVLDTLPQETSRRASVPGEAGVVLASTQGDVQLGVAAAVPVPAVMFRTEMATLVELLAVAALSEERAGNITALEG